MPRRRKSWFPFQGFRRRYPSGRVGNVDSRALWCSAGACYSEKTAALLLAQLHAVSDSSENFIAPDLQADAAPDMSEAASSSCPPPLQWQEVVQTFRNEAEPWYLERQYPRLGKYRIQGRIWGSGPSLYFLPGIGGTIDLYALLIFLLKDEFRCVLLDYPGGLEGPVPRSTSVSLAQDLFAVADQCGDRQFDVFATSFGSLVALQAAIEQPDRLGRIMLQGAFAHRKLSRGERMLVRCLDWLPLRLRHIPLRKIIQQESHRRWFPPFDDTRFAFLTENSGHIRVAALARRAAIVRDTDLRPGLSRIQQLVLLIQGEGEGRISEQSLAEVMHGLRNHRLERMHNTGHLPYLTHPHRIAKLIRDFLSAAY